MPSPCTTNSGSRWLTSSWRLKAKTGRGLSCRLRLILPCWMLDYHRLESHSVNRRSQSSINYQTYAEYTCRRCEELSKLRISSSVRPLNSRKLNSSSCPRFESDCIRRAMCPKASVRFTKNGRPSSLRAISTRLLCRNRITTSGMWRNLMTILNKSWPKPRLIYPSRKLLWTWLRLLSLLTLRAQPICTSDLKNLWISSNRSVKMNFLKTTKQPSSATVNSSHT